MTSPPSASGAPKLSGDQILEILRKIVSAELYLMLTCKRWKDGIDVDEPTFAVERLAEEFRSAQPIASVLLPSHDAQACLACDVGISDGDLVHSDVSGGLIHAACCGPEREGYVGADGGPLKPDEPIPEPWEYKA